MLIELVNQSIIKYENIQYYNNPLGMGPALGFTVELNEEQFKLISNDLIIKISLLEGSLKTSFNKNEQEKVNRIINCLIKSN